LEKSTSPDELGIICAGSLRGLGGSVLLTGARGGGGANVEGTFTSSLIETSNKFLDNILDY